MKNYKWQYLSQFIPFVGMYWNIQRPVFPPNHLVNTLFYTFLCFVVHFWMAFEYLWLGQKLKVLMLAITVGGYMEWVSSSFKLRRQSSIPGKLKQKRNWLNKNMRNMGSRVFEWAMETAEVLHIWILVTFARIAYWKNSVRKISSA